MLFIYRLADDQKYTIEYIRNEMSLDEFHNWVEYYEIKKAESEKPNTASKPAMGSAKKVTLGSKKTSSSAPTPSRRGPVVVASGSVGRR